MTTFEPAQPYRWLFLDMNAYFASVEQQDNPAFRGRPIAVVPLDTDATCAIAASYEAKALGIKTGTKIYEAKKLCPDLICVKARHDLYIEYHHKILNEIEQHIPVTKVCSVDEVSCALAKNEQNKPYVTALAHRIKQGIHDHIGEAIKCSIGIAPNAYLAKIASDMQKPDGFTILTEENMKPCLFALSLKELTGIGHNMEQRLIRAGIHTVKELWHIEPKHAKRIWGGVQGERFWYKLHGYDFPDPETSKSVVGHSRMLDPVLRAPEKAYTIAMNLTTKAAARLRRYKLYARCYAIKIKTTNNVSWTDSLSFLPTQDNFTFIKALEELWHRMLIYTHGAKLLKISVMIYDLHEPKDMTLDLFETIQDTNIKTKDTKKLSQAMDNLNKKYGANTVNLGLRPKTEAGFLGTKIAFSRIPEQEEFWE